jgi:hypothetical protein
MCQLCSFALRYQKSAPKASLLNSPSLSDAIGISDLTPVQSLPASSTISKSAES